MPSTVLEKRIGELTELEEALRDDADVMRARGRASVRLNLDDAADAVAELRALLSGASS
jgi:hypothetical protein